MLADLPLLDQGVESAKRLFDRRHGIVVMDLVQIDMIHLQTAETGLNTVPDVAARRSDVIPPRSDAAIDFRRDHDIRPREVKVFSDSPRIFSLSPSV